MSLSFENKMIECWGYCDCFMTASTYLGLFIGRGGMSLRASKTSVHAQRESEDAIFVTFQTLST